MTTLAKSYNRSVSILSLLRVIKGSIKATKVVFSCKIMTKSIDTLTSSVILEPKTTSEFVECDFGGHPTYPLLGILVYKANLKLDKCKVYRFLLGGVTALLGTLSRFSEHAPDPRNFDVEKQRFLNRN